MNSSICVEDLGKCYTIDRNKLGGRFKYRSLRDEMSRLLSAALSRPKGAHPSGRPVDFWALKGVSFRVEPGEVVGVIGRNGAGKSTLLKVLSRVTRPTHGRAYLRGRVGSLLEVGAGFHPELTGRDNIYLNGCILGMARHEIARKFDRIVEFAQVEQFLDVPVKRHSSGMYLRLAFAVAAHLDSEILLVDEVLAVGDLGFQKKCLGRIGEVAREGRTILFVSHNLAAVQSLCDRCLVIDQGTTRFDGDVTRALAVYSEILASLTVGDLATRTDRSGKGDACVEALSISPAQGGEDGVVPMGEGLRFALRIRCRRALRRPQIHIAISNQSGQRLFRLNTTDQDVWFDGMQGLCEVVCEAPDVPLLPGVYLTTIGVSDLEGPQDLIEGATSFEVLPADVFGTGRIPKGPGDLIYVGSSWSITGRPLSA
jgi:lipopolysaccharide transport system ATP-binding protein